MRSEPLAGDEAFVARCDAIREEVVGRRLAWAEKAGTRLYPERLAEYEANARNVALEGTDDRPGLTRYVTSAMLEDMVMGAI